jgi:iron complex transport system ATP-binding protein
MKREILLRIHDLKFAYHAEGPRVLNGFGLELQQGTITAILGPNGAGKTTLLHTLLGLLRPLSGNVQLLGRDLHYMNRSERSRMIGLVPQFEHIPFPFSVEEYVLLGRSPHFGLLGMPDDSDWKLVDRSLDELDLDELRGRSMLELSGGERQMVVLARALVQAPNLLLMDEPLAHLDLGNQSRIMSLMRHLADRGVTLLFTTHDPAAVVSVAREVVLMRSGSILAAGPIDATLTEANLEALYGVRVHVAHVEDRLVVLLEGSV